MDPIELAPILPGPITAAQQSNAEDSRASAVSDFDSFLTLLTAQLQNQDPLAPLESSEFVAQLASFSAVEQQIGTNDRLDLLAGQSLAGDIASFANWIGKEASLQDGTFHANGEEISFALPRVAGADRIKATVSGTDGAPLTEFDINPSDGETGRWNGLDRNGQAVKGQDVRIGLEYFEQGGSLSSLVAEIPRKVIGLRGTADGVVLDLADGGEAAPENVARIATAN